MTEVRTTSASGGAKGVKPQEIAWIDPKSILEVAEVAEMGKSKYGDHNYRAGYEWSKCYNALHRHLAAFWGGEDRDPESGLPHVAHAAWHCLALLTFMREHPEYDDRYKPMMTPFTEIMKSASGSMFPNDATSPFHNIADPLPHLTDDDYRRDMPA